MSASAVQPRVRTRGSAAESMRTSKASTTRSGPKRSSQAATSPAGAHARSEEHTSELQSQSNLVCRLLLRQKEPTSAVLLQSALGYNPRLGTAKQRLPATLPLPQYWTFRSVQSPLID